MCLHERVGRVALLSSLRRQPYVARRPLRLQRVRLGVLGERAAGVQGILERDGRVLLARRAHDPHKGAWDLPGGFVDQTERPEDALRREFLEETGIPVEPVELVRIEVEPYEHRHVFSVTYLVVGDGEPVPADDVDELRWFAADELPPMAFPGQDLVLAAWVARQQHA
jgi:8-oxo-dGTP diphosphatase